MNISTFIRDFKRGTNGWVIASLLGATVILLPILYLLTGLVGPIGENWENVKRYLLTDYVAGTLKLVTISGLLATFIGVFLAWLVAGYDFPMRRFFRWSLALPLAIPPYIAAYTYSTMTSYTGVIQATLRNHFHVQIPPGIIEVMSTRGAVFILTICLFPYVFMITRTFLERQSTSYIENARLLGKKRGSLFFKVVIPLARPAIIAGAMLVIFEVISDYGVASYFGVQTISTAIFQIWFGMYDLDSAVRLAAWLMLVVIGIFVIERTLRKNRRFHTTTNQSTCMKPLKLRGFYAAGAFLCCGGVLFISFILPFLQIIVWTLWTYHKVWRPEFTTLLLNTLSGATMATFIVILMALLTARSVRLVPSPLGQVISRLMTAGYSIPGAVVAIGVLAISISFDRALSPFYVWLGRAEGALVISLSIGMLIVGYFIRFMAQGYNAVEAGYEKIPRVYSEASRTLGQSSVKTFFKVELPLLSSAILTGCVLTFLEIIKELPLTLLLRPFNFDTLATRTYQYAIDERIFEAALPSLMLIVIGLISVLFIHHFHKNHR